MVEGNCFIRGGGLLSGEGDCLVGRGIAWWGGGLLGGEGDCLVGRGIAWWGGEGAVSKGI